MDNVTTIDHIADGITGYWLDDNDIIVIVSSDAAREKVDIWANAIINYVKNWTPGAPYLAVYDVSKSALTPYSRKKSEEVSKTVLELKGAQYPIANALVVPGGVVGHIMRLFITREIRRRYPSWNVEVFLNREDAIAWIRGMRDNFKSQ